METPELAPRTRQEALFDVYYGCSLNSLHARLYSRLRSVFTAINLFGGTAAVAGFFAGRPAIAMYAAALLGLISVVAHVVNAPDKLARFNELHRRYLALMREAPQLDFKALEDRLRAAQDDTTPLIEGLRWVAYNAAIRESGINLPLEELSFTQKAMRLVA
jgi:hypothetical protein